MRKQTKKWTTKSGEKIRICDMDNDHLENTINFLRSRAEVERQFNIASASHIATFFDCDLANQAMEQSWDLTWEDFVPDIYWNMIDDLERREEAGRG